MRDDNPLDDSAYEYDPQLGEIGTEIRHYCSYRYGDYSDIVWFPPLSQDRKPTEEDRKDAVAHVELNPGRLYGSDLMFGGIDNWRRNYLPDNDNTDKEN